jgi:hypothetical protein
MITHVGLAGYAQFKVTGDRGSDIPPVLRGFEDRVFALSPEVNTYIPKLRLTLLVRYEPEFGARNRTQRQTILVNDLGSQIANQAPAVSYKKSRPQIGASALTINRHQSEERT